MTEISITYDQIYDWVKNSCTNVSQDCIEILKSSLNKERNPGAQALLKTMLKNVELANDLDKPICQSPGYPTVYVRFGDNVYLKPIQEYITQAVVSATKNGYLRPSIVHPLTRHNPGDNSGIGVPNFEFQYRPSQKYLEMIISSKGCGAELGNVMKVMTPAELGPNLSGLKRLIYTTVIEAGGKPCPPIGLGVGIGGQMDVASKLSREAISTRDWRDDNPDPQLDALEKELLAGINALGIGPAGTGGDTTCLAIKIGMASTHTAICPVAINFHCWTARRSGIRIYPDGHQEYLFK